ncbi:MAG: UDP-N-acetyl-2-amino-2-deoxyglucuronate dehydrogenase [Abditibacteriota bacterium]|nr:UDP-N-acetyl-2-amino-2-deoxyglucuronate dehydrogenase [Abditibacteriota bacterium]
MENERSSAAVQAAHSTQPIRPTQPIRFGLIGTGSIADFHARAIELVNGAQLVAVHSRNAAAGSAFASAQNCEYEATLEVILSRDDIDAIAIATPSGTHAAIGIAAAQAGKHVLCEKPLDINVERIDALVTACEQHKVLLGAIFPSRLGAGPRAAKLAIEQNRFGRLTQCAAFIPWFRTPEYYQEVSWRGTWELDGGGALMNQGIHALDLLLWLAGDVLEVSARCQTRARDIEVEDNAAAWLRFENGALGLVQASTVCYPGERKRVELKGERGSVTLIDDMPALWQFDEERPEDEGVRTLAHSTQIGGGFSDPRAIGVQGHCAQYQDFVEAISAQRQPIIPGSEGRRAVALIRAIYQSSRQNCVVQPM